MIRLQRERGPVEKIYVCDKNSISFKNNLKQKNSLHLLIIYESFFPTTQFCNSYVIYFLLNAFSSSANDYQNRTR